VQKRVFAVGGVRDGLVAAVLLLCPDVVVEDPVVAAPLLRPRPHVLLFAVEARPDALGGGEIDASGFIDLWSIP
jgi:hypothetical protein